MKTGTAVRLTNQKIYEICHKAERGMESTIIFLDEALMNKFSSMDATDENIELITEEICINATQVYAENMYLKMNDYYQKPHVVVISLHSNGEHECMRLFSRMIWIILTSS